MVRQSLASRVAEDLLASIIGGEFPPGALLPGEAELTARHQVSRMTLREAIKTLEAQQVLSVEQGRGTFVNPVARWTSLEAVLRASSARGNDASAAIQLIELRRMLETGAAELAGERISKAELDDLREQLTAMTDAHRNNDVDSFVRADLAFHDIILHASGNVFVAVLFEPLSRVLAARRAQTSAVVQIQSHAIAAHADIVRALAEANAESARRAMDDHMTETLNDLRSYLLHP
ncbi:FadR family transcriptional regulator [Paenarthrobacter sp. Z7-10]|uniref:FadR/GntR family transcriptional regulator n=1 Tax=Paenarthrobacter sp. Z7-10 TaxID=2787635 RepID=UPI0022A9BD5D|nr:FadR/GntR family transcriptional regulator [Paenarthrobacter sp. Z7-10]MCZ2403789.1 FadR family transcriptional regulator [Paenarthrobacter sp. Z7-10]